MKRLQPSLLGTMLSQIFFLFALGGTAMAENYRVVLTPDRSPRPAGPVEFEAPDEMTGIWYLWDAAAKKGYPVQKLPDGDQCVAVLPALPAAAECEFELRPMISKDKYESIQVKDDLNGKVSVSSRPGEEPFAVFNYSEKWKKPFIYPLLGPGRARLTRGYPMDPQPGDAQDHPHHKSLWTAYGDVNGVDVWSEGGDSGKQIVEAIEAAESGPVFGSIRARIAWQDKEGQRILSEEREYRFYNTSDKARILDVIVKLEADDGDVRFGDTKEAGIVSLRVQPQIDEKGGGKMTNSHNQSGMKKLWGQPAEWVDYSGDVDGRLMGVTLFDHPQNPHHPARWHARDYGLLGVNNLSTRAFDEKAPESQVTLLKGQTMTFRYRVLLHEGTADTVSLAGYFDAFARQPVVDVVGP